MSCPVCAAISGMESRCILGEVSECACGVRQRLMPASYAGQWLPSFAVMRPSMAVPSSTKEITVSDAPGLGIKGIRGLTYLDV